MDIVDKIADSLFFPDEGQKQYKAALLVKCEDNPTVDWKNLTLQQAQSLCKDYRLANWWKLDGFREWLTNKDEWRQKLEYVLGKSLDTVAQILDDPEATAQSKVRAFEVVARLSGREPAKLKEIRYKDADLDKMTEKELDDFIKSQIKVAKEE